MSKIIGIDLKLEAAKLAMEQRGGVEDATKVLPDVAARAYRVTEAEFAGVPLGEVYDRFPGLGAVSKLRRDGRPTPRNPNSR